MAKKEFDLLCIGNALVDVFARDEEGTASRCGISLPVQHIDIKKLLEILPLLAGPVITSGGGAANTAKIAGLLGAKVRFIGTVGKAEGTAQPGEPEQPDRFGRLFAESLASAGVKLTLPLKPSPTGIFLMLKLKDGESRIAASPSAARELSESDIAEDDVKKARLVVIDGFMWDRPGLIRRILDLADQCGTVAALDLGSAAIAREHAAEIAEYAHRYSLILFMNEAEAEAFYKEVRGKREGVREKGEERREKVEGVREQRAESREQRAKSREQRAGRR